MKTLPEIRITALQLDNNRMMLPFANAVVEFKDNNPTINVRSLQAEDFFTKTLPLKWPGKMGEYDTNDLINLCDADSVKFELMLQDLKIIQTNRLKFLFKNSTIYRKYQIQQIFYYIKLIFKPLTEKNNNAKENSCLSLYLLHTIRSL